MLKVFWEARSIFFFLLRPSECGLARVLMGGKEVALLCHTHLLDAGIGAIDCHQAIVAYVIDKIALKNSLWFGVRRRTMGQGETKTGKDMMR